MYVTGLSFYVDALNIELGGPKTEMGLSPPRYPLL